MNPVLGRFRQQTVTDKEIIMQRGIVRSWFLMFFLASIVVQFLASQTPLFPATSLRKALVIGNASYGTLGRLADPGNDAIDMAAALKKPGFEVELLLDASSATMDEALVRFGRARAADQATVGFFYFAGHGIQSGSVNYLIPVGADIGSESLLSAARCNNLQGIRRIPHSRHRRLKPRLPE